MEEGTRNARFDCPSCKSGNSLSVSHIGGVLQYYCYDAQCKLKHGYKRSVPSLDGLKHRLEKKFYEGESEGYPRFNAPAHWVIGASSDQRCIDLLKKTNSLHPYLAKLFNVAYDPKEDRMVYLIIGANNTIVGGVGRTLSNQKPKSLIYPGSLSVPFLVGKGKKLVLTEDCASACSISNFQTYTGSPMLGTDLRDYINDYLNYNELILCLDPDAKKKALELHTYLTYLHPCVSIWYTPKDLKDMTNAEISEFLKTPRRG